VAVARARRKLISLEERRSLLLRRSELATLAQLPNWAVFCAEVEEDIDAIKQVVMASAMGEGISLEEQAYHRGRIAGMRSVVGIPTRALSKQQTEEVAAGE